MPAQADNSSKPLLKIAWPPRAIQIVQGNQPVLNIGASPFDAENSEYLPHNCPENIVVYPGTHDNGTCGGRDGRTDGSDGETRRNQGSD